MYLCCQIWKHYGLIDSTQGWPLFKDPMLQCSEHPAYHRMDTFDLALVVDRGMQSIPAPYVLPPAEIDTCLDVWQGALFRAASSSTCTATVGLLWLGLSSSVWRSCTNVDVGDCLPAAKAACNDFCVEWVSFFHRRPMYEWGLLFIVRPVCAQKLPLSTFFRTVNASRSASSFSDLNLYCIRNA